MLQWFIDYRIDAVVFVASTLAVLATMLPRARRKAPLGRNAVILGATVSALLVGGIVAAEIVGEHERNRLRSMLEGIAPTYAQEMVQLGLTSITFDTAPDDPTYLKLIEAQKRWEQINFAVNDIYVFARRGDGSVVLHS